MSANASTQADTREREVWELLAKVLDPEIPVLSIVDLGIVREVRQVDGRMRVAITPTYSGCPATEVIRIMVRAALDAGGYADVILEERLAPPWTSDWLTPAGREQLRAFGIAPPEESVSHPRQLVRALQVTCPRCGSHSSERISEFGSTPCKAHYRCRACGEPFDYFKCI